MSEVDKPSEIEASTETNGIGLPEDIGAVAVTKKSFEKENGEKTAGPGAAAADEEEEPEKEEVDVKMDEATGANGGEANENKEGKEMEEREPMKVEVEEKEREEREPMKAQVEEKETKEQNTGQETDERGEEAEGMVKETQEKGEEADEEGEEAREKDEEAVANGEGGQEIEDKGGEGEEQAEEHEEEKDTKKKGRRGRKAGRRGEMKEKEGEAKDIFRTPVVSYLDRPVRERKTVERLVESVEKQPAKSFLIEKGPGTPLKDIPNVAYKLSKRKPDDIRLLHLLLFGRKGKAVNYKTHIFQFSGFVWHTNEDKQRTKVKEKLDKCVKDRLLDLCDVFDIPVSRATSRKEDLVAKLLDFMVSPHATTDVVLAEKEESTKSRKRKRVSRGIALRRGVGASSRHSRKKRTKSEDVSKLEKSENETEEDGEDDHVNSLSDDVEMKHSDDEMDDESEHEKDTEAKEEYSGKHRGEHKKSSKKQRSDEVAKSEKVYTPKKAPPSGSTNSPAKQRSDEVAKSEKVYTPKKAPPSGSTNSPAKTYSKRVKAKEDNYENKKVFSREKKDVMIPKKRISSSEGNVEDKKATGKRAGRPKARSAKSEESGPTDAELRNMISEILKEVDFDTATFTDILKKLASHFNVDLTARKSSIKVMIQSELTKLAEEAESEEDDDDEDGDAEDASPETIGKKIEA